MNKIEIIAQELTNSQYTELVINGKYEAIRDILNFKSLIDNPEPQAIIPKRLTKENADDLYKALLPEERLNLLRLPNMVERIINAFTFNDKDLIGLIYLGIESLLSANSKLLIQNALSQTELDQNYQLQILGTSRAEELGTIHGVNIYPVNEHEIQAALNPIIEAEEEDAIIE